MNLLIVEDKPLALNYLKNILEFLGYSNIYSATSCEEVCMVLEQYTVDLVFMDINIKGKTDGIQCAKLINQETSLPILYTTAYNDEETVNETIHTNIYGYIYKPFQVQDIRIALSLALKRLNDEKKFKEVEEIDNQDTININDSLRFDLRKNLLLHNNKVLLLTNKEQELIKYFIKRLNQSISYESIMTEIWDDNITISALRDTIYRLKKKIPNLPLENISKIGYIIKI